MFEIHRENEFGIKRLLLPQLKAEAIRRGSDGYMARIRCKKKYGVFPVGSPRPHMDRKVEHCYPRGPVFERMIFLTS